MSSTTTTDPDPASPSLRQLQIFALAGVGEQELFLDRVDFVPPQLHVNFDGGFFQQSAGTLWVIGPPFLDDVPVRLAPPFLADPERMLLRRCSELTPFHHVPSLVTG